MEQKSNGKRFSFKNKFLNFSETKNFSTESFLNFRELRPLASYRRVSFKKNTCSWSSKGPQPYICWTSMRHPFDDCSQMVNLQISLLSGKNFKNIDRPR